MRRRLRPISAIPVRLADLIILIPRIGRGGLDRRDDGARILLNKMERLRDAGAEGKFAVALVSHGHRFLQHITFSVSIRRGGEISPFGNLC